MNRNECKNDIKMHQENAERYAKYLGRIQAKIKKLQEQYDKANSDKWYEVGLVEMLELSMQAETNAKRKVTGYLKEYPMIYLDDESDHGDGERGTYLWLYCGLYQDHNEEADPYQSHYMDDWAECQERCETYIAEIKKANLSEAFKELRSNGMEVST